MQPQRIYSVPIDNVSASALQDFLEWVSGSAVFTCLFSFYLGALEAGDAEDEGLRWSITTGHATSGSGGSAGTATALVPGMPAFAGSVEINNTTIASTGTPILRHVNTWNPRAGLGIDYRPTIPELIWVPPSARGVVRIPANPADALVVSGVAYIGEFG